MTEVAEEWARDQLDVLDVTPVRDRPWSSVWSLDTPTGRWWLKENRAGTTHETRLLALLAASGTDLVPSVRVHPDRPWALVADAGTSLRQLAAEAAPADLLDFWCGLLPRYGELQRRLPVADLRPTGVPDLSADRLPAVYAELLAEPGWFTPARTPGLDAAQRRAVAGCGPALDAAARALRQARSATLQHDDLHSGNVFAPALAAPAAARVIDWGDASLDHPFGTLLVTLDVLAAELGLDRDSGPLRRVRDAYLEGWRTGGASRAGLLDELDLVLRTAPLVRATSWARALGEPSDEPAYADAVAEWLLRLARALGVAP